MALESFAERDPLIVAGIDPGTRRLGFGVVARRGGRLIHVDHGVFAPQRSLPLEARLLAMRDGCARLFDHHRPQLVAIEEAFVEKNVQSALRLGEARGAVIVAAEERGIGVVHFPTATVKRAIGGHGAVQKTALRLRVQEELGLRDASLPLDASDALATALTLLFDPRLDPRFASALAAEAEVPVKSESRPRR